MTVDVPVLVQGAYITEANGHQTPREGDGWNEKQATTWQLGVLVRRPFTTERDGHELPQEVMAGTRNRR